MNRQENIHPSDSPFRNLYFVGAGGIGMANLERYFISKGHKVAGYDRSPSTLTSELEKEGVEITFNDDPEEIPEAFRNPCRHARGLHSRRAGRLPYPFMVLEEWIRGGETCRSAWKNHALHVSYMHIRLPRQDHDLLNDREHPSRIKRWLQRFPRRNPAQHGQQPRLERVFTMVGHRGLRIRPVIEADEYDRSFHQLSPAIAVVTSTDPDHLDIYGDEEGYLEGFAHFTSLIREGGYLLLHTGLKLKPRTAEGVRTMTYSGDPDGDWHAEEICYGNGTLSFTLAGPSVRIERIELGVPVEINIDNAVAAAAASLLAGATADDVRRGLKSFKGAKRRFEVWRDGKDGSTVLIDDYGHSPNEVKASIRSVKKLYPGRKLTVVFQPHLYTRTRDFAADFARALSEADQVIMPEIYPARELPIPGVDSNLILKDVKSENKRFCERKNLLNLIKNSNFDILMTLGAADIDRLLPEINGILEERQRVGK